MDHVLLLVMEWHSLWNVMDAYQFVPEEVSGWSFTNDSSTEDAVVLGRTRDTVARVCAIDVAAPAC
jgi:hypothetical protein